MSLIAHRFTRRTRNILLVLLTVLVSIRILLPWVVLHFANKTLATMKGYYGHIQAIDLSLIRGAYMIDSLYLNKLDTVTDKQTPFFATRSIDLSVEWKALFHGTIVGELVFEDPELRFTKDKVEPSHLRHDSASFIKLQKDFMPLKVNRFEVNNGRIRYVDEHSKPPVDIQLTQAYILAQNLRNSYDSTVLLPARVNALATVYEGSFVFNMKFNPLAEDPTFDLNAEIKNTNLTKLNEFFQAYAKVDVNQGTFGLYTEAAAKSGKFAGYVKPVIKNLDVLGKEDRKDNLLRKMWEAIVGTVTEVFQNQPKDQFATKIPFEGNVNDPSANVWYAIQTVMTNAFIRAIQPALDNEITIVSVDHPKEAKRTFLQKLLGKKDSEKKSKK